MSGKDISVMNSRTDHDTLKAHKNVTVKLVLH